jgi:hypothetical protein
MRRTRGCSYACTGTKIVRCMYDDSIIVACSCEQHGDEKPGDFNRSESPLALACRTGNQGVAKALLAGGASVDSRNWVSISQQCKRRNSPSCTRSKIPLR